MTVLMEFRIHPDAFELGRVLSAIGEDVTIEFESLVPTGESPIPFLWVHEDGDEETERRIAAHPTVGAFDRVEHVEGRTLYAFEWNTEYDHLVRAIRDAAAQLLSGVRVASGWRFTLRFPSHSALSSFREESQHASLDIDVIRVYNAGRAESDPLFGLTDPQREALVLAVSEGYYDIPRGCTTVELGERLGISDQAVTERLRRAIGTLVTNTLVTDDHEEALD
ncbi:helix-turn-helix domain-containing protein [Natronorarus salvus]|uniref:helix-turn-helix domain-containing protein n=1 Tax=Natronorarus salvus TaxID=3117733 RepID=UPI002F26BF75